MSSATETAKRNEDQIDNGAQRAADQGYDLFRRPQDAYVEVVRTWMESFNRFVPSLFTWTVDPKGLGVDEAIDSAFDLAEELLASQRRIAHQIFGASKPLLDVAVKQQRELVEQGGRVQREFVDQIEPQREAEREQAEQEQAEREEAEREQAQREQPQREQAQREQAQREQAQREQAQREQPQREQAQREQAQREQAQRERQEAKSKYQSMTLEELREAAAKGGIEGRSSLGKQQLIDALLERR
jgi:Mg-chelatase subunit ChlI